MTDWWTDAPHSRASCRLSYTLSDRWGSFVVIKFFFKEVAVKNWSFKRSMFLMCQYKFSKMSFLKNFWLTDLLVVPPVLTDSSPNLLIRNEGDAVDLYCEATATPAPTLTWLKDGRELTSTDHVAVIGRRIQLRSLRRSDAGIYLCTFKNVVGSVSHVMKLVVHGKYTLHLFVLTELHILLMNLHPNNSGNSRLDNLFVARRS